ncbi:MAG: T9SS type A sorting domain-containing protein [Paludibacteraceae bacterium]|nr:T9SS type A sorting domain-containing protein [Paludibacteraceae bacterium]
MKNLFLLNWVGREKSYKQARRSRGSLDSIVSRFCLASLILLTVGVGNAWGADFTWDLATNSYSSSTTSTVTWSNANATMTLEKNTSSTNANNYLGGGGNAHTRMYQNQTLTFTPASGVTITKVEITATTTAYATNYKNATWTNASGTSSGSVATITPTTGTSAFYGVINTATRATQVKVYYTTGGGGGGGSCNTIDVTGGSTVILPAGSTTYSANAWKNAGAPTAYAAEAEATIGTGEYCVKFTQAADFGDGNGMQLKASVGIIKIEGITSNYGVDVEVVIGSGSGISIALGATTLTGQSAGTTTISTTSTSADLTISKTTSGAGYIKTIKITPKAGGCTARAVTLANSGSASGGTFSASPTSACENATVTLTPTPNTGYQLAEWSVYKTGDPSTTVTVTNNQFTMPDYAVTVDATFEPLVVNIVLTSKSNGHVLSCVEAGSATVNYNGTALNEFEPPIRSGFGGTPGYWTAPSGGVKVLNTDGSFAAANVSEGTEHFITNGNWTGTTNPLELCARFTCADTIKLTAASVGSGTTSLNSSAIEACNCEDLSRRVTITATPTSGNEAASIAYTGDGHPTKVSGPTTSAGVTTWIYQFAQNDNGNGTFTVTYAAIPNYTVTWNVNGDASITSSVTSGSKPTFPTPNPTSCNATSTTFYGWATAPWSGKIDNLTGKTVYTSAAAMPAVTDNITYYAVFCSGGVATEQWIQCTSLSDFVANDYYLFVSPKYNNTYYYVPAVSAAATQGTFSSAADGNHVASNTTPTNITQAQGAWKLIQSGSAWKLQSKNATTIYLYTGTDNNKLGAATSGTASSTWTITKHTTENTFAFKYNNSRYLCAYNTSPYGFRTYTSTGTNGTAYLTVYHWTTGSTATDFLTTCCDEVDEPDVTVERHATYVVLSWPTQASVNSYTVTCSGGDTPGAITGTDTKSCTITGLTENTSYTYTVTATGSSCSQTAAGGFKTADCDDVPVISSAVATTTTITFNWTCSNNNSTIYIYSDENFLRLVRSKATTFTTTAKTDTIANLESGVTYYYKILSNNTCASEGGSVATIESKITIAEWDTCGVYLDLGDIQGAVAIVENQNTQATVQQKYAKGLFFSKYFEAYQNVKLWAVYNGTDHKISLANVKVLVGSNGNGWGYSGNTPNATAAKTELSGYGHTEVGWIYPGEEIIVYNPGNTNDDNQIIACATDENANFSDWYSKTNNTTAISGDDGLILIQGTDTIDVIGGMNIATAFTKTVRKDWNDAKGWWCEDGEDMDGNTIELSTNRCLLVRKNTVEDGTHAVATNRTDFNTLCEEWVGSQVPTGGNEVNSSCLGFTYVGNYDYNSYYAKYDTIIKNIELDDIRQPDGTYYIHITDLDTMSCTNLRIVVTTTDGEKLTGSWKIPIFVTDDKATVQTDDVVFTKEAEDCATCDVVVLRDANLQVVTGGMNTVRNIEIYPSATLDIPTGKTYNINSLIVRSKDDTVSRVNAIGTLTPTVKTIYLDKRITATRVYKFSLPYACNIADVRWRSGDKATYGTDWILRWYDGDRRANGTLKGNWKTFTGSTIQPGVGYDLVINSDVLEDGNKYAELRFPMAVDGENITSPATVTVPVKAYGAGRNAEGAYPNDLGWNLIGNPYLNDYTKNHMPNDLTEGLLVVDPETNTYVLNKNTLRYLVVPVSAGATTYEQVNMALTDMEPFTAYFVQIDGASDNQELNVVFSLSNVAGRSAIRSRMPAQEYEDDNHIVWFAVDMAPEIGKVDETTLLISNRFNDKFEMMDDMFKIRNAGQSIIATRNDDGEMVFNALPDNSAAVTGVPVHYFAASAGTYTISVSNNYSLEEIAEAWLYDKTNGQYKDLLTENYSFTTAAGDNTDRFTLFVRVERKKQPEIATGNDNILANGKLNLVTIDKTLVLSGLTSDADVYVYDMSGKLLTGERANGNGIWRATVPATGVYFVRVNSIDGQQTLRTIVK